MAPEQLPDRCVEHKVCEADILSRIKVIEEDVREISIRLRDKADNSAVKDIVDRSTREIEELKKAVLRLDAADLKHSEALAGIHQILKGFKETQDLMRQDYSKLADCYTQTSVHIASITTILAERARKEDEAKEKIEISTNNDPWYVRLVNKSKVLTYALVALIGVVIWIVLTNITNIFNLLQNIFGK